MTTQVPTHEQIRAAWDTLAPGFDEFTTPVNIQLGEQVIGRLDIRPGTRVLDVAAGSGALSIPAARLGAEVAATDIAPAMIERLTARAKAEGLTGVKGMVMDGHALEFADGSFDAAVSQHGVSILPDVDRGLAEMARVTRPGGTVLVSAFGPPPKAEFIMLLVAAVKAAVPGFQGLPTDPPPLPFQLADPETFAAKLTAAGLSGVTVETNTLDIPVESAAHLWSLFASSHPIGAKIIADLTATQVSDALQVLDGVLRERSGGEPGAVLHVELNIGTATK